MFKNTDNRKVVGRSVLFLFCSLLFAYSSHGQEELLKAIEDNDTASFDRILASGYNVNKRKTTIKTKYAVSRKRRSRSGKIYIDRSARRDIPLLFVERTDLPIKKAVFNGNYYFTEQLLKHGAKPDKKKNTVLPPLAWAAHMGHSDLVKLLLFYNADINGSEKKWRTTPLIEAIEWKRWEIAKYLIDNGADVNLKDRDGNTALTLAAVHKHMELVKILVGKGADVNHKNKRDVYVLEAACSDDRLYAERTTNLEILNYLVEQGASTNNNAIHIVSRKGEREAVKFLLGKGAPVSGSLVLSASNGRSFELFRYLVDTLHLDIHYHSPERGWKENVLHGICRGYWSESAYRINVPMLQYALEKGVNVNDTNINGESSLLLIANGSHDEEVRRGTELLIRHGAKVNISGGNMRFSPLMSAAHDKHLETALLLIKNGADVNAVDYEGRSILHWAS